MIDKNRREDSRQAVAGLGLFELINQHGEIVCEFERTMLVMRRGNPLEEKAGY